MEVRKVLSILFLVLVFCSSCASRSMFIRGDKTKLLGRTGREGDIVLFLNNRKSDAVLRDLFGDMGKKDYIYDIIAVINGDDIYGVIEGVIPRVAHHLIIDNFNAKKTNVGDFVCYKFAQGDKQVFFNFIKSGVVLFSFSESAYKKAFEVFIENKENIMSESLSFMLQNNAFSVYAKNPKNDFNAIFKNENIRDVILLINAMEDFSNKEYEVLGVVNLKNFDSFKVVNTQMSGSYVQYLKENGQKVDVKGLAKSYKASFVGNYIGFYDMAIPEGLIKKILSVDK